jgi:hypothetical protein
MDTLASISGIGIALLSSMQRFGNKLVDEGSRTSIFVSNAEPKQKTPKLLFALFGAFLLCGAVSGCATVEKCGLEGCAADQKITSHVTAMLEKHPDLDANMLTVQTLNHVVYLDGLVESDLQSDAAAAIAKHVKGVKEVVNNISVNNN